MLNTEELRKLSERRLAEEYVAVMGRGPRRIPAESKDERIKEMIDKLAADAAKDDTANVAGIGAEGAVGSVTKEGAAVATTKKAKKVKASTKNGTTTEAKRASRATVTKNGKKTAAPVKAKKEKTTKEKTTTKAPKEARKTKPKKAVAPGENPYRESSLKHSAYAAFRKAKGDRKSYLAAIENLNVTEATAKAWYSTFTKLP